MTSVKEALTKALSALEVVTDAASKIGAIVTEDQNDFVITTEKDANERPEKDSEQAFTNRRTEYNEGDIILIPGWNDVGWISYTMIPHPDDAAEMVWIDGIEEVMADNEMADFLLESYIKHDAFFMEDPILGDHQVAFYVLR